LVGEIQAVIKPLGPVFYGMSWVSGFTILGGGNVALIFDVGGMIKEATSKDLHKEELTSPPVGGDVDQQAPRIH
jgi:two-component system chemotaxis sensor kinase CheA